MSSGVDSNLYDQSYYLDGCEGFKEFRESAGQYLSPRLQHIAQIAAIRQGETVLDIGAGRGEMVFHAASCGADAVGIDYSEAAVDLACQALDNMHGDIAKKAIFLREDAQNMTFSENHFNLVTMLDVVEHLHDDQLQKVIAEVKRVLRPGGRLVIHTDPNRNYNDFVVPLYWRWVRALAYWPVRLCTGKRLKLTIRNEMEKTLHVNEQTPTGLRRLLNNTGFEVTLWTSAFAGRFWTLPLGEKVVALAMSLWPFNNLPILRDFLNTHIFVVAIKSRKTPNQ